MFNLFQKSPLLDEASIQWMFDCYAWALRHFDAKVFFNETILVVPTNDCFPGEGDSPYAKADLILQQVKHHAGMGNWPVMMAGVVISVLPILIAFVVGQKYFVRGIALTGIKG